MSIFYHKVSGRLHSTHILMGGFYAPLYKQTHYIQKHRRATNNIVAFSVFYNSGIVFIILMGVRF